LQSGLQIGQKHMLNVLFQSMDIWYTGAKVLNVLSNKKQFVNCKGYGNYILKQAKLFLQF